VGRRSKQTVAQKQLERISIEREKELRVENARQTTKAFSDNIAFRKKLRGIFSLLSGGFSGFSQLGVSGGRSGGGGGASGGGGRTSTVGSGSSGVSSRGGGDSGGRRGGGRRGGGGGGPGQDR